MYQSSDTLAGQAATAAVAAMPHPCPAAAMDKDGSPVRWTGRQAIVTLPQHMDESNAGQIREKLLLVINRGATELIADLTQTDSCDHMGADAVARAYQRATAAGTQLRLVVTAPAVQRVLTLNGFDRLIPVYPSLAAAMAAGGPAAPVPVTPGSGIPRAAQPEDLDRAAGLGVLPGPGDLRHSQARPGPGAAGPNPDLDR